MVLTTVLLILASFFPTGLVSIPSEDVRINDPARDPNGMTQNDTCSAAAGTNIIVSYTDRSLPGNASALSYSRDEGHTWTQTWIPTYPGGMNTGRGMVAAGIDREFYYATMAVDRDGVGSIGVTRSDDGGATWLPLVDASASVDQSGTFQLKPWLAVDTTSSRNRGNLYLCWISVQDKSTPVLLARSTDGGRTWSQPTIVTRSAGLPENVIMSVGPEGEVYVAFSLAGIQIMRSTDAGATFRRQATIAIPNPVSIMLNGGIDTAQSLPSMAVDASNGPNRGHVYIMLSLRGQGRDAADVAMIKSTDGGRRWSNPVRVSDDTTDTDQWLPSLAVARNGTLAVMWYDRRHDALNNSLTDVYMTTSIDGGRTFAPNQRLTSGNWMFAPTPVTEPFGLHGSYNQISAGDSQFIFNWSDHRNGDPDVFMRVKPDMGSPASQDFVVAGRTLLQNIVAGGPAAFTIATEAIAGFGDAIEFSATPTLPGIGYRFSPAIASPGNTTRLTVTSDVSVPPGSNLITITGQSEGLTRTTHVRLVIYPNTGTLPPPIPLTSTREAGLDPSVLVDRAGTLHVAWTALDRVANTRQLYYSQRPPVSSAFSRPVLLSNPLYGASQPVVAIDALGTLYVMWTQLSLFGGPSDVYLCRSADGGLNFSSPADVSRTGLDEIMAFDPAMTIDSDGILYLAWTQSDSRDGTEDVFLCRSLTRGNTFTTPVNASNVSRPFFSTSSACDPTLCTDEFDNVHLMWTQSDFINGYEDVFFSRLNPDTQTLSSPSNLSQTYNANIHAFGPSLVTDGSGGIFAVWTKSDTDTGHGDVFVSVSRDRGFTFSTPENLSLTAGTWAQRPSSVAINQAGHLVTAWTDVSTGNYEIFLSQSTDNGHTFSTPVNVSRNIGASIRPSVAAGSGFFALTWEDDSDGIGNIFLTTIQQNR